MLYNTYIYVCIFLDCLEKLYSKEMLEKNEMVIWESLNQKCREAGVAVKSKAESDLEGLPSIGRNLCSSEEED